jgi:hypothetical protein
LTVPRALRSPRSFGQAGRPDRGPGEAGRPLPARIGYFERRQSELKGDKQAAERELKERAMEIVFEKTL